jgi:hypothetical protein
MPRYDGFCFGVGMHVSTKLGSVGKLDANIPEMTHAFHSFFSCGNGVTVRFDGLRDILDAWVPMYELGNTIRGYLKRPLVLGSTQC